MLLFIENQKKWKEQGHMNFLTKNAIEGLGKEIHGDQG